MGESKKRTKPVMTRLCDENKENEHAVNDIESFTCDDENISESRVEDALCRREQNHMNNVSLDVDVGLDDTPTSAEAVWGTRRKETVIT